MADKNCVHIPCGHRDSRGAMLRHPDYKCPGCGEDMMGRDILNVSPGATGVSVRGYNKEQALAKWRRENEK
jgi:hypothetical protein